MSPTVVLDGLGYGESPRWHDGRLWFCNWGRGEIRTLTATGRSEVAATVPTTLPFSIDWLPDGRLLVVSGPEALVLVQDEPGTPWRTYADLADHGAMFNEIVVGADGVAYVNGATLVTVAPDGSVRTAAEKLLFGNGMAITADGAVLLVAESHGRRISAFDLGPGPAVGSRRTWAELGDGVPDGICLDADGALWYADVPNRRCVRVCEGGEVLDTVAADRGCFACMLGGADGRDLYVAAAQWPGMERVHEPHTTGQVLVTSVAVAHAGRP